MGSGGEGRMVGLSASRAGGGVGGESRLVAGSRVVVLEAEAVSMIDSVGEEGSRQNSL